MIVLEQDLNEPPFYGAEVSGEFKIELLELTEDENGQFFDLEIEGLTETPFQYKMNVEDAGGNADSPDPGDVFRTLMELLKRTVCPHCL